MLTKKCKFETLKLLQKKGVPVSKIGRTINGIEAWIDYGTDINKPGLVRQVQKVVYAVLELDCDGLTEQDITFFIGNIKCLQPQLVK